MSYEIFQSSFINFYSAFLGVIFPRAAKPGQVYGRLEYHLVRPPAKLSSEVQYLRALALKYFTDEDKDPQEPVMTVGYLSDFLT